jgi:hypothetical protein
MAISKRFNERVGTLGKRAAWDLFGGRVWGATNAVHRAYVARLTVVGMRHG